MTGFEARYYFIQILKFVNPFQNFQAIIGLSLFHSDRIKSPILTILEMK